MTRLLVATAVDAERDAVLRGLAEDAASRITVATVGVGPAAAAAGTARLLALAEAAGDRYHLVLSAGIGGGVPGRVPVGGVALARRSVAVDLGADSPDGFIPLDDLGFGSAVVTADPKLLAALSEALPDAVVGDVVTASTVTGTADGLTTVVARAPDAVAEGMEGFGVASAAVAADAGFGEVRAISNPVGPRDRAAWRIAPALDALRRVGAALGTLSW
ncbi:MAG TPA: futalosine hydrolase [Micromonosporaceae bacterium]